jgi:hypothetical protein
VEIHAASASIGNSLVTANFAMTAVNNENSIHTANDVIGFGCEDCCDGNGVGAGYAIGVQPDRSMPGTIWAKGR